MIEVHAARAWKPRCRTFPAASASGSRASRPPARSTTGPSGSPTCWSAIRPGRPAWSASSSGRPCASPATVDRRHRRRHARRRSTARPVPLWQSVRGGRRPGARDGPGASPARAPISPSPAASTRRRCWARARPSTWRASAASRAMRSSRASACRSAYGRGRRPGAASSPTPSGLLDRQELDRSRSCADRTTTGSTRPATSASSAATGSCPAKSNRTGLPPRRPGMDLHREGLQQARRRTASEPSNIIDHGYPLGAVNLAGQTPIILVNDGPSMGGFINPYTVPSAAFWKLGQSRPGDVYRFKAVTRRRGAGAAPRAGRAVRPEQPRLSRRTAI